MAVTVVFVINTIIRRYNDLDQYMQNTLTAEELRFIFDAHQELHCERNEMLPRISIAHMYKCILAPRHRYAKPVVCKGVIINCHGESS